MRCGHDWKPIEGWVGRYRCSWCNIIGYRKIIIPRSVLRDSKDDPGGIIPYKCGHPKCKHYAHRSIRRGEFRCLSHSKKTT
jgi:hypothetical protein